MKRMPFPGNGIRVSVLVCLLACALPRTADAQAQGRVYEENFSVQVTAGSMQQQIAWCGGLNNPQFASADLDQDGVKDLVVYERYNNRVKTFLNKGTPGNPVWVYNPTYAANFPPVSEYLILTDYNRDGIPDLFHMGDGLVASRDGIAVFKGYYANSQLFFTFYKTLWYTNDTWATPPINAYVNPTDIPAVADVDGDGDLDFIAYGNWGTELKMYQNTQVESSLPADSIRIRLADRCWGRVDQGLDIVRTHQLRHFCDNSGLLKPPPDDGSGHKTTHSGNTICLFDADGDGDFDYLDGNVSFNDMVFLRNGKVSRTDSMVEQDTTWQENGKKVNLPQWPTAFWVDGDGDGLKDLLISPHAENTSENYKCVWFYRNTGTAQAPQYTFRKDTFLIEHMIDVGTAAYPMLYDYNRDGKPDLFVGSDGYYQPDGTFRSRLSYYENTSAAAGSPSFKLVTKDLLQVFAANVRGSAPATGDLDNDGKDDLVLGHTDGTLTFYRNAAADNSVQPDWQRVGTLHDHTGSEINVDGNAMPFIYDLNKDGKQDLLIGYILGKLYYYENTGSQGAMQLTMRTDTLGGVMANDYYGKSAPFIGRIDNSGKDYIVLGSDVGNITRFTGFQNGNITIPYTRLDSNYSYIDAGFHTALTIGDIDGDGKYDMIVGNEFGGLNIYRQVLLVDSSQTETAGPGAVPGGLQLYPNPASARLYVGMSGDPLADNAEAQVFDNMGRRVLTAHKEPNNPNIEIDISRLAPGVYLCRMQQGTIVQGRMFVKQ